MLDFAHILLIVGLVLIAAGGLWGKLFYQRQTFVVDKPLLRLPPLAATILPYIKHSLLLRVPKSIRTDESGEVSIEYFQGVIYPLLEGLNSFLYEKLEVTPRALPNVLRGAFFAPTRVSTKKEVTSKLTQDFGARLSSSKFSVAPDDWKVYKRGTKTPCRWRWSISCNELGKYDVVIELNEAFQSTFPEGLSKSYQVILQVEVRSPIGLSLRTVTLLKYSAIGLGGILGTIATLIISLPYIQNYVSNILQQWLR